MKSFIEVKDTDPDWVKEHTDALDRVYLEATPLKRIESESMGGRIYGTEAKWNGWRSLVGAKVSVIAQKIWTSRSLALKSALVLLYWEKGGSDMFPSPAQVEEIIAGNKDESDGR